MADEQGYLVPRATLDRIQAISDWVRNFRISGPYVSSRNTPAGMAVYVGAPRKPPTPAPAPPTIVVARIDGVSNNYISVLKLDADGNTTGSPFNVAKPFKLRHVAGNYGLSSMSNSGPNSVTVTYSGGRQESWAVTPAYLTSDIVHIVQVPYTGVTVSGEDLKWIDLNVDGRAWGATS